MIINLIKIIGGISILVLVGCTPAVIGSVVKIEGGNYQSSSIAETKQEALRITDNDAKATCDKKSGGEYVVVSQETERRGPKESEDAAGKAVDAAAAFFVGKDKVEFEVTTIFKCE